MEKQHHQYANKNEDPLHHGIQYSTVRLRNMDIHGYNKRNVTDVRKQVLQKKHENEMDTIFSRVDRKETILQKPIRRKMSLFGHVARLGDDRKLKTMMFGVMEGKKSKNKRG